MPTSPGRAYENSLALLGQQLGVDWASVIQHCDEQSLLAGGHGTRSAYALWTALEHVYNRHDFPFAAAQAAAKTPSNFAQLAFICSPNLRTAITRAGNAKNALNGISVSVTESVDALTVSVGATDASTPMPESMQVGILAYCVAVTRIAASKHFKPLSVNLPESSVLRTEAAAFFGIEPGSGPVAMTIQPETASIAFRTNHDDMWSAFEERLSSNPQSPMADSVHVQEVLYALLPSGCSTVEHVAEKLAVSKRTLQRKLSAEGETYQRLLHKTRQQLAHYYLATADVTVNEIAGLLGYRDPHSFLRAYRGWTGERPVKVDSA